MYLTPLDFIVVAVYFLGLMFLGVYFSKRHASEESYFLGNRRMPWIVVGVCVMATLISSLSYIALPGEIIRYGIGYFTSIFALVLVIPVVGRVFIPAFMHLPVTSVYEYFEIRFDMSVRYLAAVLFVLMRLAWIGLIIYATSFAVAKMTGWNASWVIIIVGLVTTFYTTMGGARAVTWTGFIQGIILLGGAVLIPLYIGLRTGAGPIRWIKVFSQAGRAEVPIFSWDPTVRITMVGIIISMFFAHLCVHGADQVVVQRYLSTTSLHAARRSFWISQFFGVTLFGLLMLVGIALFFFYWNASGLPVNEFQARIAPTADEKFPEFIARELPFGLSGLMLSAILAAAMSSISAAINSISTVVVTDFIENRREAGQKGCNIALAMAMAATSGALGIAVALLINQAMTRTDWNLIDLIARTENLFLGPLGAMFLTGIVLRRVAATAALVGFAAGVAASFLVSFSAELFGEKYGLSFMWIIPTSFVVTFTVSYLAGWCFPPPSKEKLAVFAANTRT